MKPYIELNFEPIKLTPIETIASEDLFKHGKELMDRITKQIYKSINDNLEIAFNERGIRLEDLQAGKYSIHRLISDDGMKETYICPEFCPDIPLLIFEHPKGVLPYEYKITRPTFKS